MIPNLSIEVQTSPVDRPSVPAWFAEVVILSQHLTTKGLLEAFAYQVQLVRGRFGSYEPLDFLALLVGSAVSSERTLADFFHRVAPFGAAFMALFGYADLPHRPAPRRFLANVDRPCLEAFRQLFEQYSFAERWTSETIGGIWNRQDRHSIVFDLDATRQAARQRALPCEPPLPSPRRRLSAVCAPGYTERKRREVVRTRTIARRDAYPSMDRHRIKAEAVATIKVNSPRCFESSRPTWGSLLSLIAGRSRSPRRAIW